MTARPAALALTDDLPERRLDAGQQLFEQHDADHSIVAVLVDGALRVEIDGSRLPRHHHPGLVRR